MSMKNTILLVSAMCVTVQVAVAQNIDPTVEVTRGYKAELVDVHKPSMEMSVPDSVYKFDFAVDYTVADSPYGGAYEFSPYTMEMKPESLKEKPSVFYLNAGVGYTLHPTLDVLYSPALDGRFGVNLYGVHRSYVGDYRAAHVGKDVKGRAMSNGYDLMSGASADMRYDWDKTAVDLGVSYYGVAVNDFLHKEDFNALDVNLSVKSKSQWSKSFMYDVSAAYRFGDNSEVREHLVGLDVKFGPALSARHKVFVDAGTRFATYQKLYEATFGNVYVRPRYHFEWKWFKADFGLRASYVYSLDENFAQENQYVYPDIRLNCIVGKDVMRAYLNVTGGEELHTYSSLLERNHHFYTGYQVYGNALLGASLVRVKPELGLEGRVTKFFSYDLRGGYSLNASSPVGTLIKLADGYYCPALAYSDHQQCFAKFDWNLSLKSFRFDGSVKYTCTWGLSKSPASVYYVVPSQLTAEGSMVYNWNRRLYVGVDCQFASSAKTSNKDVYVPYYVDLGAFAEYSINRKLSVWLRGGNLMNMEIQRNLLFAEKGINFTAGICLTLQ